MAPVPPVSSASSGSSLRRLPVAHRFWFERDLKYPEPTSLPSVSRSNARTVTSSLTPHRVRALICNGPESDITTPVTKQPITSPSILVLHSIIHKHLLYPQAFWPNSLILLSFQDVLWFYKKIKNFEYKSITSVAITYTLNIYILLIHTPDSLHSHVHSHRARGPLFTL